VRRTWSRWIAYLLLVPLAAGVGIAGSFVQQHVVYAGGIGWPVGSLIALGGCAGLFFGGAALTGGTTGTALPVLVWFGTVLALAYGRSGDVVLPNTVGAALYLFGGALLAAVSIVWIRLASLRARLAELDQSAQRQRVTARVAGVGDDVPPSNE
jgi:hypothetical protein